MSEPSDFPRQISPKKIRSKHRRRILSILAESEATVTELAHNSGLRTPHVSAEIRRMRNEGLASSDLLPGSRGARISLTENGWKMLEQDEWSKVLTLESSPLDRDSCCLISRDEDRLTLCFLSPPKETMVQIPNRILNPVSDYQTSTRNSGVSWTWAVLSERSPRWFDKGLMTVSDSPPELVGPENIEAYTEKAPIFGVVRAKLLDSDKAPLISLGKWFTQPNQIHKAPLDEPTYHRGEWALGSPHSKSPDVRPSQPVAAVIKERLPRSVLLRSARSNSLILADVSGLDIDGNLYPLGALDYWIEIIHPRVSVAERKKRLSSLRDRITTSKRIKIEESTLRKFRKDWGGRNFLADNSKIDHIDLRGLNKSATESLIRWSIDENDRPLVIEIKSNLSNSLQSRIASKKNLRLVIMDEITNYFSSFDTLRVDRIRTLPWLSFCTISGDEIPVRMVEKGKTTNFPEDFESSIISPWDILGISPKNENFKHQIAPNSLSIIKSALSQYPEGDEEWANQIEAQYPLAAWIATPKKSRWQRWQRVSSRLDTEWMALLDFDYLPIERISELANDAPVSVKHIFSETITSKLRSNPDNLLRSWPAIDPLHANSGAAWLACHFIQNSAWLPKESYPDILGWAVEAWLSHPPQDSIGALTGLKWLYEYENRSQDDFEKIIFRISDIGANLPEGHQLNTWSRLLSYASKSKEKDLSDISFFIRDLPHSWWAPFSSEFLVNILESDKHKDILETNTPWCSLVLRPIGEKSEAPGLSSYPHPGCDVNLHNLLQNYLRPFDDDLPSTQSLDHLRDLLDALQSVKNGMIPVPGRSHKLSGWLAQPRGKWPDFSIDMMVEGNKNISERLIMGKSGYHVGLSEEETITQPLGS